MTTSKNTVESKEFEVLSTEGVLVVHLYDCCPDAFEGISFQFSLIEQFYENSVHPYLGTLKIETDNRI